MLYLSLIQDQANLWSWISGKTCLNPLGLNCWINKSLRSDQSKLLMERSKAMPGSWSKRAISWGSCTGWMRFSDKSTVNFSPSLRAWELTWEKVSIDHINPKHRGGVDHPYNYCIMERSLNSSFRHWVAADKAKYIGKKAFDLSDKFARWIRDEAIKKGVDFNDFDQQVLM